MSLTDLAERVAEHVAEEADLRSRLETQFRMSAQGKAWFDGIFPHQWQGSCFGAVAERWVLTDEPGAGKTRQAVAWWDLIGAKKIIVVCEPNLANQFAGEIMDLAEHRNIVNLTKKDAKTRKAMISALLRMDEAVAIINYEMFRRDSDSLGRMLLWQADTVVVDEAHNLKNVKTANFKHAAKIILADNTCPACGELIYGFTRPCGGCGWKKDSATPKPQSLDEMLATKSVKNTLLMTGTPLLNTPLDLYALLYLTDPFTFSSMAWFKKRFLQMNYAVKKYDFLHNGVDLLKPYIEDRYIGRTLEEVGVYLPKQRVHIERVDLDPERYPLQARTVKQLNDFYQIKLSTGETMTLMHLISVILRKRQAMVWPGGIQIVDQDKESPTYGEVLFSVGKEVRESCIMDAALERILELHKQGRRQIVFSQFTTALREFGDRLEKAGLRVCHFDGQASEEEKDAIRKNWIATSNEPAKWDVVLAHYRSGGSGLNLTAATATHILDEEWNAGKRDQAYKRDHRIGQEHETDVYVYRVPNSVCTWMANLIDKKERMMNKLGRTMSKAQMEQQIVEALRDGSI